MRSERSKKKNTPRNTPNRSIELPRWGKIPSNFYGESILSRVYNLAPIQSIVWSIRASIYMTEAFVPRDVRTHLIHKFLLRFLDSPPWRCFWTASCLLFISRCPPQPFRVHSSLCVTLAISRQVSPPYVIVKRARPCAFFWMYISTLSIEIYCISLSSRRFFTSDNS